MQVRDEVIEILPSLPNLSRYVQGNTFFTENEAFQVVIELNRYGSSSTLNKILQFDFSY